MDVRDEMKFYNFMVACAARSGQLFNASDVAGVAEVDHKTAKAWLSVLQASGIVRIVQPIVWMWRCNAGRQHILGAPAKTYNVISENGLQTCEG